VSQAAPAAASRPRPAIGTLLMTGTILGIISAFVVMGPGPAWDTLFINPLINSLLLLTNLVGGQFGVAIILFTVILRVLTIPFTLRQLQSTRAMQEMQPQLQEINKKYKDPKRRQEETLKVYRDIGFNPLGCFMPLAIQMLVFIALYRALAFVVGGSPESLVGLSQKVYPWSYLTSSIPLEQSFLWLELGEKDNTLILPLLVGVSTYVQTRLTQTPSATPQQQQQQQMMTWMMPIMMVFITQTLPSGVGVYWIVSNIFSIFASWVVYGRRLTVRSLLPFAEPADNKRPRPQLQLEAREEAADDSDSEAAPEASQEARSRHGKRRGKRKKRR
jgi:YidC/Oxa1 family membrane protein insertase